MDIKIHLLEKKKKNLVKISNNWGVKIIES